ncbi:MAG: hypothetical protein JXA82_12280 [Sedimentisphaerales bacterium]|nr:hypothetical protein [Sedimentisphaerales bacterium]
MKRNTTLLVIHILAISIASTPLVAGTYSGGAGTEEDPYQISTAQDLIDLGQTKRDYNKHFILITDIDLSGQNFSRSVISPDSDSSNLLFQGNPFSGVFDGNDHMIANLMINGSERDHIGLFGFIDSAGIIKNLRLENVNITTGQIFIGGLCGENDGLIDKCSVEGSVAGNNYVGGLCGQNSHGTITHCYTNSDTTGNGTIGGLCGSNKGVINLSYTGGKITGWSRIGGLCGANDTSISNSYSTGEVTGSTDVGGLCGKNSSGSIIQSYATGNVIGNDYIGGLCGENTWNSSIVQCYAMGEVTGNNSVGSFCGKNAWSSLIKQSYAIGYILDSEASYDFGGFCGWNYYGFIRDCFWDINTTGISTSAGGWGLTTEQMKQAASFWGWLDGAWTIQEGVAPPRLAWEKVEGNPIMTDYPTRTYAGTGTLVDPYRLASPDDLVCLGYRTIDWDSHFILISNIDMSNINFTHAVIAYGNSFEGILDGDSHVISNLVISDQDQDNASLFYRIGHEGQVMNLGLKNINIVGRNESGGLCGENKGTISQSYAIGTVRGVTYVGGLCGKNYYGLIHQCYTKGVVTGDGYIGGLCGDNESDEICETYAESTVTGDYYVGGLCGGNQSSISLSYATGNVTGNNYVGGLCGLNSGLGEISSCYAVGVVNGINKVGGMCGENWGEDSSIYSCYWDIQTSSLLYSDGGVGKTTLQMQTLSTFTNSGWDFLDTDGDPAIWMMLRPGEDYPRLAWQEIIPGDIAGLYGVDAIDFSELATHWQQSSCPTDCEDSDIDQNGQVDVQDLLLMSEHWLTASP